VTHRKPPAVAAAVVAVVGLAVLWPSVASARPPHGRVGGAVVIGGFYSPYFYSPFLGPFGWGYGGGPYSYAGYGPYGVYGYGRPVEMSGSARIQVTPKDADVFVDGYRAGKVDDFDGAFQRLNVRPGPHEITIFREGYRTITEKLYLAEGSTMKIKEAMEKLAPGEKSERPIAPPPPSRRRSRDRDRDRTDSDDWDGPVRE